MAEVADFNFSSSLYDPFEEDEVEPEDSISYWPHEFDHEEIYSSDPDLADRFDDPEDEEEMAAVEDFGSDSDSVAELNDFMGLENEVTLTPNSNSHSIIDGEDDFGFQNGFGVENDGLELGLGLRLGELNENDFDVENDELELELGLGLDGIVGEDDHDHDENGGVMVNDDDDDDDDDDGGGDDRVFGVESDFQEEGEDEFFGVGFDLNEEDGMDDDVPQGPWEDSPEFDDVPADMNEFYEWEDVDDAGDDDDMVVPQPDANERLVPTGGGLDVGMDFEQRLPPLDSLVAEAYGGEEVPDHEDVVGPLEWQILMHVSMDRNRRRGFLRGDFVLPAEYDMVLAQFAENADVIRGSPPAARLVVENLPTIVLIEDDANNDGSMCAVCKDEISTEEQVKLLPCSHFYHGDCILPWLEIHNTCPVCRFELPTDDPEYEQTRARRHNLGAQGRLG